MLLRDVGINFNKCISHIHIYVWITFRRIILHVFILDMLWMFSTRKRNMKWEGYRSNWSTISTNEGTMRKNCFCIPATKQYSIYELKRVSLCMLEKCYKMVISIYVYICIYAYNTRVCDYIINFVYFKKILKLRLCMQRYRYERLN